MGGGGEEKNRKIAIENLLCVKAIDIAQYQFVLIFRSISSSLFFSIKLEHNLTIFKSFKSIFFDTLKNAKNIKCLVNKSTINERNPWSIF